MDEKTVQLNAKISAQAMIIDALLATAIKANQLDVRGLVEQLEQFVASSPASWVDPIEDSALKSEVSAWADMLFELYWPDKEITPSRSKR